MARIQVKSEWISPLTKRDQIAQLNEEVRVTLKPSRIEGIGVFAIQHIRKGDRCYCTPNLIPKFYNLTFTQLDDLVPEVKEIILQRWASVVNGSVFQHPNDDAGLLFFMNHSDNPNYDIYTDTALREISKGEEITENYCLMENANKVFPKLCK